MIGLLVVTHGGLAAELVAAARLTGWWFLTRLTSLMQVAALRAASSCEGRCFR